MGRRAGAHARRRRNVGNESPADHRAGAPAADRRRDRSRHRAGYVRDPAPRRDPALPGPHALAELRGTLPEETTAIGIQPEHLELSLELSPVVSATLPALLEDIEFRLRRWGYAPR